MCVKESTENKKSICFCIPGHLASATGGAELQTYLLAEEFVKDGWEVSFLNIKRPIKNKNYINKKIKYFTYQTFPRIRLLEAISIYLGLRKTKASFFYQRTNTILTGVVALYCKLFSKTMIWSCAHDLDCYRNSERSAISKNRRRFQNSILNKIAFWISYFNAYLVDRFAYFGKINAHIRIAQTKSQQQILYNNFSITSKVMANFLVTKRNNDNMVKKQNLIIWVANIKPFKRPELFLNLVEHLDVSNWNFFMIAHCNDKNFLNKMLEFEQQRRNFKLLLNLPVDETEKYFAKAKILVNTSDSEGFSNTFLQAWYYRACIFTLKVDPDNILKKEKIGIVQGNDNIKELATKLKKFIANEKQLQEISDRAYKYVVNEHNISSYFDELKNLLISHTARDIISSQELYEN